MRRRPSSPLDQALLGKTKETLQRLEDSLPSQCGAAVLLYTRGEAALELTVALLNEQPGEAIKILAVAQHELADQARQPAIRYELSEDESPTPHLVSSLHVRRLGAHDHVTLWNRGGRAGMFILEAGDGALLAEQHGLVRK